MAEVIGCAATLSIRGVCPREFAVVAHIVLGHAPRGKTLFKGRPDRTPVKLMQPTDGCNCLLFIVNDESCQTVLNDFRHGSAPEGNDRCPAGHGFDHHQAERLGPVDGKKQSRRILQKTFFSGVIDLADEFGARGINQRLQSLLEIPAVPAG